MNRPADPRQRLIPARWRFSDFRNLPRGCPHRIAAARRIKQVRACRPRTVFDTRREKRRAELAKRHRRASVWLRPGAVGCCDTGELFVNAELAAVHFTARGVSISKRSIIRACGDGREIGPAGRRIRFVWLNRRRWTERRAAWKAAA